MRVRQLIHRHASALGWSPTQGMVTAQVLAHGDPENAFAALGRGPASGPEATSYNTSLLVLAALAGGAQAHVGRPARALFGTPLEGADPTDASVVQDELTKMRSLPRCPVTGTQFFGEALCKILENPKLAADVDQIEVQRGSYDATLHMRNGPRVRFVKKETAPGMVAATGELRVTAALDGEVLAAIARDLAGAG